MKIVFDNKKEMKRVIRNLDCPSTFGLKDKFEFEKCERKNCEECIKSAIEMEVQNKKENEYSPNNKMIIKNTTPLQSHDNSNLIEKMEKMKEEKRINKISVKDVVCDYGVYEGENLIYIFNDRENAKLVKQILEKDSKHKRYRLNEEKIDLLEFLDELSGDDRNTFYNLLDEMKLKEEEIKVIKEVD